MNVSKGLRSWTALLCVLAIALPPLEARTRKGDKLLKLGEKADAHKDYDAALNYFDQALATDPQDPAYLMADQRERTKAAEAHIAEGKNLQQLQKLEEALIQFQKAYLDDPSSQIAIQEIQSTTAMIKERAKTPPGTPVLTPAERARLETEKRINSLEAPPTLRPINAEISSLKMNNQPARVLYETVGKLAGINVLFDPQGIDTGTTHNFNLDLNNVTLEEALDYIALETHTFWKAISRNAIFVTQDTEPKRQEYQDEVVKVFYIQNAGLAPNDFLEIFQTVRTVSKVNTSIFALPTQNAFVVRGTPDTIALIEKMIHDLDRPKPEVLVDVIVMEVNKTKASTIGASLLGQGGLSVPINYTPRNPVTTTSTSSGTSTGTSSGTGTSTSSSSSSSSGTSGTTTTGTGTSTTSSGYSVALNQLGRTSTADFSATLPSTLIQALMSDTSSHVLQRPQLRVTDGGKASLKIGQKIPYVSGSLNSAVATPGSIPYATTQFQQVDVGTNIDLQPHVNGTGDITMHIKVEISNVLQQIAIAGIDEPEIGQQVDETDIRMKDGEVSILGGLSDKELSSTISGFPGLTNIPLLGYLFGTKIKNNSDSEILIALIPHIIRAPDLSAAGEEGVLAGTERVVKVEHKPEGTPVVTGAPAPVTPPAAVPITPPSPLTGPKVPIPNPPATTPPQGNPTGVMSPGPNSATPPGPVNPSALPPRPPDSTGIAPAATAPASVNPPGGKS